MCPCLTMKCPGESMGLRINCNPPITHQGYRINMETEYVPSPIYLPFLTYETIRTGSDSPESQRHMLPLNTGEPGELGDGNSSVAPPAVYGRGFHLFKRGIGCVSCASKDARNLALFPVSVNCCIPWRSDDCSNHYSRRSAA